MMREWKDGVPRGAYHGVVTSRSEAARIFIVPSPQIASSDPDTDAQAGKTDASGRLKRKTDRKAAMGLGQPRLRAKLD